MVRVSQDLLYSLKLKLLQVVHLQDLLNWHLRWWSLLQQHSQLQWLLLLLRLPRAGVIEVIQDSLLFACVRERRCFGGSREFVCVVHLLGLAARR